MKKYAKIECGRLVVPQNYPGYIIINGQKVYEPTEQQWQENGYKPLIESEPEEIEGKTAVARYEETETEIVQHWDYIDIPDPDEGAEPEEVQPQGHF